MKVEGTVQSKFEKEGFAVVNNLFSAAEVKAISRQIEFASTDRPAFRKSKDLFAIRQILKEIPELKPLIFTGRFIKLIYELFGNSCFVIKSIYFDKPATSNWSVPYHQDLTISVDRKTGMEGFGCWTVKQNQYAVQPPVDMLQNNFTIRIHLDDTDIINGALKVIPGSHLKGIVRLATANLSEEKICEVKKGGVMLMRPLLLHASGKSTHAVRRRVIHIEFSDCTLPSPLQWSEFLSINLHSQLH